MNTCFRSLVMKTAWQLYRSGKPLFANDFNYALKWAWYSLRTTHAERIADYQKNYHHLDAIWG